MNQRIKLREEILEQLRSFGISGKDVYFIDYIPLIEMIWADGQPQQGEKEILYAFFSQPLLLNTISPLGLISPDMPVFAHLITCFRVSIALNLARLK